MTMTNTLQVTLVNSTDEAIRIPLEDLMGLADAAFDVNEAAGKPGGDIDALYAALGKPTGTEILGSPVPTTPALDEIATEPGDYVVENCVTARGLRRLKVQRLGRAPRADVYVDQALFSGARLLEAWGWVDEGRRLHTLMVVWKSA